jgi:hypothetical protein
MSEKSFTEQVKEDVLKQFHEDAEKMLGVFDIYDHHVMDMIKHGMLIHNPTRAYTIDMFNDYLNHYSEIRKSRILNKVFRRYRMMYRAINLFIRLLLCAVVLCGMTVVLYFTHRYLGELTISLFGILIGMLMVLMFYIPLIDVDDIRYKHKGKVYERF